MFTIPTLIIVAFFVLFAVILIAISLGMRAVEAERKKKVSDTLRTVRRETEEDFKTDIIKDRDEKGDQKSFDFNNLPFVRYLDQQLRQAEISWSPAKLLIAMGLGGVLGVILGLQISVPVYREAAMVMLCLLLGALPFLYVRHKRNRRLGAFEEQFPECLDFLGRSLRAGHAFSVGLEMLGEESPEPAGAEFRKLFHELNLGAPIDEALRSFSARVPLLDVKFFVSAVLLQRETGGNLAEILDKLAYVIRERFRIKGHVKAVSAHGRITAMVLTLMPLATMLGLMIVAPQYLGYLAADEHGKYLIVGTIVGMLLGYYWMRKIIDIKV